MKILALVLACSMFWACGDGSVTEHFDNGNVKSKVFYLKTDDGKKVKEGLSQTWFENEQMKSEVNYTANVKNGVEKQWFSSGTQKLEANFVTGKRQGKQITWDNNGKKRSEVTYKNNILDGQSITWNAKGVKVSVSNYKNGKKDGEFWEFSDKGKPFEFINYKEGKKNGEDKVWCRVEGVQKDIIAEERTWVEGKQEGKEIGRDCDTGKINFESNYKHGMLNGNFITYEGSKRTIDRYRDNKKL